MQGICYSANWKGCVWGGGGQCCSKKEKVCVCVCVCVSVWYTEAVEEFLSPLIAS